MVRICPVSIPWFRSKKTVENGQSLLLSFAPVNFPKNGLAPAHFPNLVKFNRVYSGGLAPMWICCGSIPIRGWGQKNWTFENVPGSIPDCGRGQKKWIFFKMFLVLPNCGGIDQIVFSKCSWFDSQLRHGWLNREHLVEVKSLKVSS